MRSLLHSCLLVFAAPALAQTFVVDVANGPGTSFTSIAAATAAVPDGAILLVRPGTYAPFTIDAKGLKMLCDAGALVLVPYVGGVVVSNTAPQQGVVIRNLLLAGPAFGEARLTVTGCQGPVLIDVLRQTGSAIGRVHVDSSSYVLVRNHGSPATISSISAAYELFDSNVVLESCTLPSQGVGGRIVTVTNGTLQIVDSTLQANVFSNIGPLLMNGGDVRLLGTTQLLTNPFSLAVRPVDGTGTLRVEPTVSFVGASPPVAATIAVTTKQMPRVTSQLASGVTTVRLTGPTGHLAALALSLPGPRIALGFEDALWLDASLIGGLGATVLSGAPFTVQLPTPPAPLPGARIAFQAITFDTVAGFQLSNPSFVTLP